MRLTKEKEKKIADRRRFLKRLCVAAASVAVLAAATVLALNLTVIGKAKSHILRSAEAASGNSYDCILVLGCSVRKAGSDPEIFIPSDMLEDRLLTGLALYEEGAAPKLLVSGDHGKKQYDEVSVMKDFLKEKGVPEADIFMDHAGFSTYESVYRAKAVFGAEKILIVTQEYHLYRALYIAESLGLEADGVPADLREYFGQPARDLREIAARVKDVFSVLFHIKPSCLGAPISLEGDGTATDDRLRPAEPFLKFTSVHEVRCKNRIKNTNNRCNFWHMMIC